MKQAYVAGSCSHPTEEGTLSHIRAALGHAHALTAAGWHCIVPHVMGSHRASWDEAMDRCRSLVRSLDPRTDALVTLPGWQNSKGAREEVALARAIGLPVLTVLEAIRNLPPCLAVEAPMRGTGAPGVMGEEASLGTVSGEIGSQVVTA
jgi:hypothetical protein